MLEPNWQGRPIRVFKREIMRELVHLGMDLWDVVEVLKEGYDCARSKRKSGIVEKCKGEGKRMVKVVVQEGKEIAEGELVDIWVLRHVK